MEKEVVIKKKIWLSLHVGGMWQVTKVQGFFPVKNVFTEEELRDFLTLNDDVEPVLTY
jgi:hypothetical protein